MEIKSIKFNFVMNFILKMSAFIFPIITFPYVSRILSPDGIGQVSFATSVISYFQMFASLGIPTYGLRACAKVRDNKEELSRIVHELAIINLVTTVIVYIVFFLSLFIVDNFREQKLLLMVTSVNIIFSIFGFEWLYSALEQYKYITMRSLLFKVLSVVALFVFVHNKGDYIIYAMISVFSGVGSNICNLINLRKIIYLKKQKSYSFKMHIKPILVLFAMSVAGSIYTNLDMVMLGFMSNSTEVGYYTAAVKMKNILLSMIVSLGGVMLPRLSYYIQNGKKSEFLNMSGKAFNVILYTAIPVTLYFSIFAGECIDFLSGVQFAPAIPSMQIIMPTVIFIGLTNMMGYQILVPTNRESLVLLSVIVGAVIDIILNAILIPLYGSVGASLGTLFAELGVLILQIFFLRDYIREIKNNIKIKYLLLPLLIAALSGIAVKLLVHGISFVVLVISAVVFWGIYAALFLLEKEPISRDIFLSLKAFMFKLFKKE